MKSTIRASGRTGADELARRLFAALLLLTSTGCINSRDALRITVRPEKTAIRADEPIRLAATLTANKGPVCLTQNHRLRVEVLPRDRTLAPIKEQYPRYAVCGMGAMLLVPWYPLIVPLSLLDIADAQNRYQVLERGECRHFDLPIVALPDRGCVVLDASAPDRDAQPWPPGEYMVRVSLDNQDKSAIPGPAFWRPYNREVAAETWITIRGVCPPPTTTSWRNCEPAAACFHIRARCDRRVPDGPRYATVPGDR